MMQVIHSALAPEAIGAYSQAICVGQIVYLSGQIPLDPQTMQLCSDDIRRQIQQVFTNLNAVCKAAGGTLANMVKLTVYLTDLAHFSALNEIMQDYFVAPFPARAVVQVSALPRNAKVEVDGVLILTSAAGQIPNAASELQFL